MEEKGLCNKNELTDICDIFNKHGSDKDKKGYLQVYHCLFHKFRYDPVSVLEINRSIDNQKSLMESSLYSLRDYFVDGRIIGISLQEFEEINDTCVENYFCDATKKGAVEELITKLDNVKFDIIIDSTNISDIDSTNISDIDQINTIRNFYPHLKDNGLYIIENIHPNSKLIQCPSLIGCLCNHDTYFFAGIKNNMCVINKYHLNSKRNSY